MALSKYKVVWSDEAIENKNAIEQYLARHWTVKEIRQFYRLLDDKIAVIAHHPEAFSRCDKAEEYRKSVLISQITIYYKFENDTVEISSVFDTRQNPDNLNLTQEEMKAYQAG